MNHKGVSQAVAWVLLVGLSISLAIFVGVWLQQQSEEVVEGIVSDSEIRGRCSGVYFNAVQGCDVSNEIANINFTNTGSFTISKFKCNGEDTENLENLSPTNKVTWQVLNSYCNERIQEVILVPFVKIEDEEYGCAERTLTINC